MEKELKTLKDTEESLIGAKREDIFAYLKAEAVNDIKKLKELIENNSVHALSLKFGDFLLNPSENFRELFAIISYIKWKNNLTEEDLKNGN